MCEAQYQRSHSIHNFSTSTGNVQVLKKSKENAEICGDEKAFLHELHHFSADQPEENSGNFLAFSIRTMKFIDSQRIGANQQTLFFDQDDGRVQRRALWRVDLIFRTAHSIFVKMHERVV